MRLPLALLAGLASLAWTPARAEVELSFYAGPQSAPHSDLSISGAGVIPDLDVTAGWEGRSFSAPIHAGGRVTFWRPDDWGWGFEVNHTKVYADDDTLAETGLDHLEFSDGLNIVTVNAFRRFPDALDGALGGRFGGVTPYLGAGAGVSVPHVEVTSGDSKTWEYQITGPAVAVMAGASLPISDRWSVFGEYKGTYSRNEADLEGGGTLETDIVTNALNLGVSFRF